MTNQEILTKAINWRALKSSTFAVQTRLSTYSTIVCLNIRTNTWDNTISPMPFNTGIQGMWKFDGSFYWMDK